jgi:two-component system, response regulator PdtaR
MGKKIKVLITEDKSITALDLKNMIENMGLIVTSIVKSGEEALRRIKEEEPDLILMDIMLKGYYSGIETAEIIKREYNIPLIYITALNDDETFLRAFETNPTAIIIKPFTDVSLREALKKVLKSKIAV